MGGFGNTLFQIFASKILIENGRNVKFSEVLVKNNFITRTIKWKIHQPLYGKLIKDSQFVNINSIFAFFILNFAYLSKLFKIQLFLSTFTDGRKSLNKIYSKNIFGYFQNREFLKNNQDALQLFFDKIRQLYGSSSNRIVMHYRRGDSEWANKHLHYYREVKEKIRNEKEVVTIVTDSQLDAEIFFKGIVNIDIQCSNDAYHDFKTLLLAKKLYCAPSTFSWWAAHSLQDGSQIVMPEYLIDKLGAFLEDYQIKVIK